MTAPDGVIDLPNDILGVIRQFNHSCQERAVAKASAKLTGRLSR